ncbi:Phage-related minor tail protein [Algoriella xinjiangensis]|uniref:phage tail tape measure protein n=1 Tax=Algoriella xinjiangensis TaxID=684065 RepID=UPI000F63D87F|nr:phage tail tape measure protein [Algoriella xinjiangensis]VDH16713.1 Phage-related minor tail protein [Algoriella xinjiangensis]
MANGAEKIRLMELDLDIDLMLKKAAESKKSVEQLQAQVKKYSDGIKENQKLTKENSSEMEIASKAVTRMENQYSRLSAEQKANADVGGLLLHQIDQQKQKYNESKSMIESLTKSQENYRKELEFQSSELRKEQKEYSALKRQVDVVNKTFDDHLNIIRTTDGSEQQLGQALANNRKILKSMPEDMRENSTAGKELAKIVDEQDKAFKSLNSNMGINQPNVGDYRGQLEDLFNSLKAGEPVVPALTTAFKGLYAQFVALAMNPVGATIMALAGIAAVTKMWYDYNLEMSKSTRLVQQFTGLAGDELQSLTVKTRELAEVSGEGEKQILQAVTATANAFGLTYDEAFKKVQNGWIKSGVAAEDYFDNSSEYATHFQNAGYSADEFFSVLEAGAKNGIYKDKLTDTIKEIDLRLSEMPKSASDALTNAFGKSFTDKITQGLEAGTLTTKMAFDEIIKEADKMGLNLQQKQTLVADVMGAAGEDAGGFNKAVEAINEGLANTHRELTDIEKAQQLEIESTQLLEQKWASLFDQSGGTFEMLKAQGKAWINGVLVKLIDGTIEFANGFIETYNNSLPLRAVIAGLGVAMKNQVVVMMSALKLLWNGLKTSGKLLSAIFTFDIEGIKSAYAEGFTGIKDIVVSGATQIADNFSNAVDQTMNSRLKKINVDTKSLTSAVKENTEETKTNTKTTEDNAKSKDKKTKSSKDATKALEDEKKAQEELRKEEEKQLKVLQEIADSKIKLALNELENDIKNREEKLKLEKQFTDEVYKSNIKLFEDKQKIRAKELEEEKRLALQKIENDRLVENQRIDLLKISEEEKAKFKASANENAKAQEEIIFQDYKQKTLENDATLDASRREAEANRKAYQAEIDKINQEVELQNKLLKIEQDSNAEYEKRKEIENLHHENDLVLLKAQLDNKEITEEQYRVRKDTLEFQHGETSKQIERDVTSAKMQVVGDLFGGVAQLLGKNSKAGKAAAVAQATINTYQGITEVWSAKSVLPEPFGTIQKLASTATVLASGLGAVKNIKKTKLAKGGLLEGPSHAQGGIPFTVAGTPGFEAEGGEFVVNKKSTAMHLPLLKAINGNKQSSRVFQNGGMITAKSQGNLSIDYDLLASKIGQNVAQANKSLPAPKVAVTEINDAQSRLSKVEQKANF